MAEEIEYGSARITVELDDAAAVSEARALAARLKRVLESGTRNVGKTISKDIQRGLAPLRFTVPVDPDTSDFGSQLARDLRRLDAVAVQVTADTRRFRAELARELRPLDAVAVPVEADPSGTRATISRELGRLDAVTVPLAPDVARLRTALAAGLRGLPPVPVRVEPDVSRFRAELARGLRALDAVSVAVTPDVSRFRAALSAGLSGLAAVAVKVEPDVSRFRTALAAGLRGLDPVQVRVGPDVSRFQAAVTRELNRLDDVAIRIRPNMVRFRQALVRQAREIELMIRVVPDLRRFDRGLLSGLRDLDGINIPILPDLSEFEERLLAGLSDIEAINIPVRPDFDGFDEAVRGHRVPPLEVEVDTDTDRLGRALSGLAGIAGRVAGALGGLLKFGAVGIAVASATTSIIGLVGALAPAVGILAAVPAVLLGVQAASGALKLALLGVGDAFSAALTGTAEEFTKSLEDLSPAARAAAQEVRALQPEFKALRSAVQDAFFGQLEGQITAVAQALGGPLQTGLSNIAAQWGRAASAVASYVSSTDGIRNVEGILSGTSDAMGGLAQASQDVVQGVLEIGSTVAQAFGSELASGIQTIGDRFGSFLFEAARGGDAVRWVDTALNTFAQLGDLLGNIGSILSGVFGAANVAGAGFLANLQKITASFAEFVNSDTGQSAITGIFQTVATVAAQLGPILAALVTQVGAIAPALAPIFTALGPALVNLINALGPGLAAIAPALASVGQALAQGLAIIGPSLAPLGAAVGAAVSALAPLLPLAGQLVATLAGLLAPALQTVVAAVQPVIAALVGALLPALPPLTSAFSALLSALIPLGAALGQALGAAITGAAPLLQALADALAQVATALVPVVQAIVNALIPAFPPLISAFSAVVAAVLPLLPAVADLVAALAPLVVLAVNLLAPVLQVAAAFVEWLTISAVVPIIEDVVGTLTGLASGITSVVNFITGLPSAVSSAFSSLASLGSSLGPSILEFFTGLPDLVTGALSSLGAVIGEFFTSAFATVSAAVTAAFNSVVAFFAALPGQILAVLAALPGALVDLFTSAVAGVAIALLTAIAAIIFIFTELPVRIAEALVSLGTTIGNAFTAGYTAVIEGTSAFIDSVVAFFTTLPERAGAALTSLGTTIVTAFTTAFNAAYAATTSFLAQASAFFQSLPGRIGAALSALGSAIGGAFTRANLAALNAVTSGGARVLAFFRALPGRAASALASLGSALSGVFGRAFAAVGSLVSSAISRIAGLFRGLGSRITAALGNIGAQIVAKIKAGLPGPVRALLPFADGGIVNGPTPALIGEAGPEVVIPLSKPKRARQLVDQSGLLDIIGEGARKASGADASALTNLKIDASRMVAVGQQMVAGMILGMQRSAGALASATQALMGGVVVAAEDELQISSPSKRFEQIGKDTGDGFVKGFTGSLANIDQITKKLISDIEKAFKGVNTKLDDRLIAFVQAGNVRLKGLATQRDSLIKRIADAQKFAADTTESTLSAFTLDKLSEDGETGPAALINQLEGAVLKVRSFAASIAALRERGLRSDLLQQVIGLGPERGAELAKNLQTVPAAALAQINTLQAELSKSATQLGQTSADALFDAGKQAGAGFLTGLKAQQKSIEQLMLSIALGMQKSIRAALKIKSPSQVFADIGLLTGEGLEGGLLEALKALLSTTKDAAAALASTVAGEFEDLPSLLLAALSGLDSNLTAKIRDLLRGSTIGLIPFASGGVVTAPTAALVGEAGPEVIIPLTRPQRARQLAEESGLAELLAAGSRRGTAAARPAAAGAVITNHWTLNEVGDAETTARRVLKRLTLAAAVL